MKVAEDRSRPSLRAALSPDSEPGLLATPGRVYLVGRPCGFPPAFFARLLAAMDLRNRRGAISLAEGCLFAAVGLFVLLLIALLLIAYLRFRNPPSPIAPGRTSPAAVVSPGASAWPGIAGRPQPRFGATMLPPQLDA